MPKTIQENPNPMQDGFVRLAWEGCQKYFFDTRRPRPLRKSQRSISVPHGFKALEHFQARFGRQGLVFTILHNGFLSFIAEYILEEFIAHIVHGHTLLNLVPEALGEYEGIFFALRCLDSWVDRFARFFGYDRNKLDARQHVIIRVAGEADRAVILHDVLYHPLSARHARPLNGLVIAGGLDVLIPLAAALQNAFRNLAGCTFFIS